MRLRRSFILAVVGCLAAAGCAAAPAATTTAPSAPLSALPSAPPPAPLSPLPSAPLSAPESPISDPKEMASPLPSSSAIAYQPQVYVTAAQLLNPTDGAIVVKDCSADGSCAFRADITSDGGATWRRGRDLVVADPVDNGSASGDDPLTGLTMVSATDIYAYGASVWHTTNAGVTWTQLPGAPAVDEMAVSNGEVWATVACADLSGCASSVDVISSGHFTPLPHQPGSPIGSIVREGRTAYAVLRDDAGTGDFAVSHDDGTTWQLHALPQKYCTYSLGSAMTVTSAGVIYLVCANGASAGTEQKDLFTSDNGAVSWQHVTALELYGYADGIIAATPDILWRDGGRAPMYVSTDAGKTWKTELSDEVGDAAGPMTQAFAAAGTNALVFAFAVQPDPTFAGPHWTVNEYRSTDVGAKWQTTPLQP